MTQANTYYSKLLANWSKAWGSKPTAEMFNTVHAVGKKPGVEALHLAMCLRPEGCTVPQFTAAGAVLKGSKCGPANNTRKAHVAAGLFTQTIMPGTRPYAFALALTSKGKAMVKAAWAAAQAADKAAVADKPKAAKKPTSKPRKPKATVTVPATVPAPVTVPTADTTSTH
jgi:hypothetical protein